jgi:CRP/FNR family transcriptional regulator, cyclic AMP receptor protein
LENVALLLQKVSIFAGLPPDDLADLAARMRPRSAEAGCLIVSQEGPGDALFVIVEGKVKVALYGDKGKEIILSILHAGDFFGEMSLLDRQPRSANVVALGEASLLWLDREAFQNHLVAHPTTALAVLAEMSRRLRRADAVIGNLALLDVYARVGRAVRELAHKQGEPADGGLLIRERPTQQEMAGMVGSSRETVNRALQDFARRGLLELHGKQILVRWSFLNQVEEDA